MTTNQLSYNSEIKMIKDSLTLLKNDIKRFPLEFFKEYDVQARLYYHLCNAFEKKYPNSYYRIHMEYNPHLNYDKEIYLQNWRKCLKNYGTVDLSELKDVSKKGTYDIAILDENNEILRHVIELKKITSVKSEPHKGYEDLYVLSNLLDRFEGCRSYFFILAVCNSKYGVTYDEMKDHINNIKRTYENTNRVHFDYFIYDKSINFMNKE